MDPRFPGDEDVRKPKKFVWLHVVIVCAELHLFREFLRENESFSKTILACLSGAQVG